MKLRKVLPLIVLAVVILGLLGGAASAEPRKETFKVTWIDLREGDPVTPECGYVTGNVYHEKCGSVVFDFVECTNPKVCGRFEFWTQSFVALPQTGGMNTRWRIDVGPDAYWEGSSSMIQRHKFWTDSQYGQVIARFEGRGHGAYEGLLIKGDHWYEPGGPEPYEGAGFKAVLGGEIIQTGR